MRRCLLCCGQQLNVRCDFIVTKHSGLRYYPCMCRDKIDIFHTNGFDFKEDDQGQLHLTAVPFSKDTVFGIQDVQELLHLMSSGNPAAFQMSSQAVSSAASQPAKVVRPSRYCTFWLWCICCNCDPTSTRLRGQICLEPHYVCRVRAMLAMRACRSSVMIGKALTASQMQTILSRLSALESPWNCPHGRPTLRHLSTLAQE